MNRILNAFAFFLVVVLAGCVESAPPPSGGSGPSGPASGRQGAPTTRELDPQQAERLKTVMTPLLQKMDHPIPMNQVRIGVMEDSHINAANAGGGSFFVTTGLLQRANDSQLSGVMAHEVAHADLGHVTKLKTIATGVNLAAVLLDAVGIRGAGLVPIAGELLVERPYSREAEYQADRHGAELLTRTGRDGKAQMADTLTWLQQSEGASGGGFFATHPSTPDRIERVRA